VVVLTVFAPGKMAGAEKVVSVGQNGLADLTKQDNFQLAVIKENKSPSYADDFFNEINDKKNTTQIITSKPIDLNILIQFNSLVKKLKPNIIHTHGYKALIYIFLAKIIFLKKYKIVHTHHGNTGHTFKVKIYESFAMFLMKFCSAVISVSPKMTDEFKAKSYKNIKEVTNMFSLERNKSSIKVLDFKHTDTHFLYLGRLSIEKNPLTLLEAFTSLQEKVKNIQLHIVGDGPLLQQCEQKYKNDNKIHFYGHQSDVRSFIESSDFLCLPSLTEGMPMTVIESLCLGTPIIANKVGALPYMCHDKNSILIDIDKYLYSENKVNFDEMNIEWTEVLERALSTNLKDFCQSSKNSEISKYSIETWVENTLKVYKEI
jgi:glycosyltransferase involved in cell wall biosynthesis